MSDDTLPDEPGGTRDASRFQKIDAHAGQRLRLARLGARITEELAEVLGITFQQIQKYERGTNRLAASTLLVATRFLGVAPEFLFEGLDEAHAPPTGERAARIGATAATPEGADLLAAFGELPIPLRGDLVRFVSSFAGYLRAGEEKRP